MRVCLVNTRQAFAGGERWFLWAAQALASGHEVMLLAAAGSGLAARARRAAVPLELLPRGMPLSWKLNRLGGAFRPQAVMCNTGGQARAAVAARAAGGGYAIVLRRGLCRRLAGGLGHRLFYPRLDHIVCNSRAAAEAVAASAPWLAGERLSVLYNPVIPLAPPGAEQITALRQRLGVRPEDYVVASVGRLDPDKGHRCLLEAFARLSRRVPRARLLIAGEGRERERLEAAARTLGIESQTTFCGFVAQVAALYRLASVLAQPSLPGYESFSNAALEAMDGAVPVVATEVGGFPELVASGKTGILVPPGDAEALGAALIELAVDPQLRRALGAAGREKVRRAFDPSQKAAELGRLLERVAAARQPASAERS